MCTHTTQVLVPQCSLLCEQVLQDKSMLPRIDIRNTI
jgi:hypothetical protein